MARFSFIPREGKFFQDFIALGAEIRAGAGLLDQMVSADNLRWEMADEVKAAEHRADTITHELLRHLNQTFVTPFDREDIHALARSLDDVMDAIDDAAAYLRLYKVRSVRRGAREMAAIILQSTEELHRALQHLEKRDGIMKSVVEINRLENEADRLHSELIGRLFDEERDPIEIIKWQKILSVLEQATDRCEDVANVLESVVVKYS
ncbi:MAG: putative pit accessory protein [Acidobacteria bacterium]|jgi:hypothetical protein|nr:putative pit accessory protein [Acidobacteriota bacterium]